MYLVSKSFKDYLKVLTIGFTTVPKNSPMLEATAHTKNKTITTITNLERTSGCALNMYAPEM